eukprot:scaffold3843_cov117-Isochrysis_galbana.AAC.9
MGEGKGSVRTAGGPLVLVRLSSVCLCEQQLPGARLALGLALDFRPRDRQPWHLAEHPRALPEVGGAGISVWTNENGCAYCAFRPRAQPNTPADEALAAAAVVVAARVEGAMAVKSISEGAREGGSCGAE